MMMNVYVLAIRNEYAGSCTLPRWEAIAAHDDYSRAAEQYAVTEGEKIFLVWQFTKGVLILRAQFLNINLMETMQSLEIPMDKLPGTERAALLPVVHRSVMRVLNGK